MNKKAQGISINTIIIAAIALIVLVVLVAIFTGRLGGFSLGVANCEDKGGTCESYTASETTAIACDRVGGAPLRNTNCEDSAIGDNDGICCI
jgi:hypothetical protein